MTHDHTVARMPFQRHHDSEHGIVIIHQELALVPMLSIAENIFLGNEHARYGIIDWNANETRTSALLKKVGLKEDPKTLITNIGVGKQQLVEIAKALSKEVKLLILDEPTASLSGKGQPGAARPAARIQAAGHHLDPDLAQAQRGQPGRRSRHHHPRRPHYRDPRQERYQRRPHHHVDGGPTAR
jgi:ABC-type branched-subunit amino acid transport system ATPase component